MYQINTSKCDSSSIKKDSSYAPLKTHPAIQAGQNGRKYDVARDTAHLITNLNKVGAPGARTGSRMAIGMQYKGVVSFRLLGPTSILAIMKTIGGIDAIRMMQEVSKLPDGQFTIAFYKYNRTTGEASAQLQVRKGCKTRAQLPQERFQIPSDNYFLFLDADGNEKTCFRTLIRFIGFPPEYNMLKVNWFKDE